jgi:hydroxyacylglutathione hydrolase
VLDVRRAEEHESEAIEGAVNVPIHEITRRAGDVPDGEVWVHCESGYRASIAASVLDAAGRQIVVIDDLFEKASDTGLAMASGEASGAESP